MMQSNQPATRDDWRCRPLPEQQASLHTDRTYTPLEMKRIKQGVIPEVMEDKWFIFYEDDVLYLHRSWTGYCVYKAHFQQRDDRWHVERLMVNRDPDQYTQTDDEYDARLFDFVVDLLLLGRRRDIPVPKGDERSKQQRALGTWSLIGRAMMGGEEE